MQLLDLFLQLYFVVLNPVGETTGGTYALGYLALSLPIMIVFSVSAIVIGSLRKARALLN